MRFEGLHHSFVARIPDSQRFIVGRADNKLAARMEDDASHPVVVSNEGEEAHPGGDVPHANRLIPRAGREEGSLVCALVVRSGRRVNRRSRALRRPCDALYHVLVFSELDLTSSNFVTNGNVVLRLSRNGRRIYMSRRKLPLSPSSPHATLVQSDRLSSWR